MIHGLHTVCYPTPDLAAGKSWYREVLGIDPYLDESYYVGFMVGGFELGLLPEGTPGSVGAQAYWTVDDVSAELQRLIRLGGAVREDVIDVGGGVLVASVLDPFGNAFGIIQLPPTGS